MAVMLANDAQFLDFCCGIMFFAEECVVNQRRVTVGHLGVGGKLGVLRVLCVTSVSRCSTDAGIDVGVTVGWCIFRLAILGGSPE